MPTATELIAHGREVDEIRQIIGADGLIFRDLNDLIEAVRAENPDIQQFECSVFNGVYVTKDVDQQYLDFLDSCVMTMPKRYCVRTKRKTLKCTTKVNVCSQARAQPAHPCLQLTVISCKVGPEQVRAITHETTHHWYFWRKRAIYGVRLLQVLRDVTDVGNPSGDECRCPADAGAGNGPLCARRAGAGKCES